jgi:hypothetical protein
MSEVKTKSVKIICNTEKLMEKMVKMKEGKKIEKARKHCKTREYEVRSE